MFGYKSTHTVEVETTAKTVAFGSNGWVMRSEISAWLHENVGKEAIRLSDLSKSTNGEQWWFGGLVRADAVAYHFTDKAKAALFKLTWA